MSIGKEIIILRARISDSKKRLSDIDLRADSYISIIRDIIDPYAGDFTDFDMERALVIMNDFYRLWEEARELKAKIVQMEKDLNG